MNGRVAKRLRNTATQMCIREKVSPGHNHGKYMRHKKGGNIICANEWRQFYKSLKARYYRMKRVQSIPVARAGESTS